MLHSLHFFLSLFSSSRSLTKHFLKIKQISSKNSTFRFLGICFTHKFCLLAHMSFRKKYSTSFFEKLFLLCHLRAIRDRNFQIRELRAEPPSTSYLSGHFWKHIRDRMLSAHACCAHCSTQTCGALCARAEQPVCSAEEGHVT